MPNNQSLIDEGGEQTPEQIAAAEAEAAKATGGEQTPEEKAAAEKVAADKAAAEVAGQPKVPDNFPEKFLVDGKPDYQKLVDGHGELEKVFGSAPDNYEINLPEGVDPEEFFMGGKAEEDPLMQGAIAYAKKTKMSQENFDGLLSMYTNIVTGLTATDPKVELEALGDDAKVMVPRVKVWVNANLKDEDLALARVYTTTAAGIRLFDKLVLAASKTMEVPAGTGGTSLSSKPVLTKEQIRAKMDNEDYWNPQSANYKSLREEVAEDFKRLNAK